MAEMILPGTYIEVRAEGLTVPRAITVGNLGIVGTANKGPIGKPVLLGGLNQARDRFGNYDAWIDGTNDELTLVRALELAYGQGATTVFAVRVAAGSATKSSVNLQSSNVNNMLLRAKTEGKWGDRLAVNVAAADDHAFREKEAHNGGGAISLTHTPVVESARNRIRHFIDATGVTNSLAIIYGGVPLSGQVSIDQATGALTFLVGEEPAAADLVFADYTVDMASARKVTIRLEEAGEVYTVVSMTDLAADLQRESSWVEAGIPANPNQLPDLSAPADAFASFSGGNNGEGAASSDYQTGLDALLNEPAHIIVAAGQDDSFGDELAAHCKNASSDSFQRERISLVGGKVSNLGQTLTDLLSHNLNSDRVIFVGPGIKAVDAAALPPREVTLPGAYAAAAVAGMISSLPAHHSPTNRVLNVGGLEQNFNKAQLTQLVQSRVLALETGQGVRIVKGITTATDTAWHQITTRRIVDFAKFGVRSASDPFIGKLNNERVRQALKGSINGFLADMIDREMLTAYELDVSATRDQEIRGIAQVIVVLQPTFSIDFIQVTMFLQ